MIQRFNKFATFKEGLRHHVLRNTFELTVWLGGIALMVLGLYSSVVVMIDTVESGGTEVFSCEFA